jgi:hypothetical protein
MHNIPTTGQATRPAAKPARPRSTRTAAPTASTPPPSTPKRRASSPPSRTPTLPMPALNLKKKIPMPCACRPIVPQPLARSGPLEGAVMAPARQRSASVPAAPRGARHQGAHRTFPFIHQQPVAVTPLEIQFPRLKAELAVARGLFPLRPPQAWPARRSPFCLRQGDLPWGAWQRCGPGLDDGSRVACDSHLARSVPPLLQYDAPRKG